MFSEALEIGSLRARNRLVRAATYDGLATSDGRPTDAMLARYEALARGGVGTIVTGYAYVRPDGIAHPNMISVCDDPFVETWRPFVERMHELGARIVLQIAYAGSSCKVDPVPARSRPVGAASSGRPASCPPRRRRASFASLRARSARPRDVRARRASTAWRCTPRTGI